MAVDLYKAQGVPPDVHYVVHVIKAAPYFFPLHRHYDFCDLLYVLDGQVDHSVNGKHLTLRAGDLALIRPGETHQLSGPIAEQYNLAFPLSELEYLLTPNAASESSSPVPTLLDPAVPIQVSIPASERLRMTANFRQLLHSQDQPWSYLLLRRFLCDVFLEYLMKQNLQEETKRGTPDWILKCLNVLERDPQHDWQLEDIFDICCRSREHVTRSFRKHLDRTPSEVLNVHRLKRAERLLRFTTMSISRLAVEAGFHNLSHFNRLFRKHYGVAPRTYRKENSGGSLA